MGAPGQGHGRGTPELQRTKAHSMTVSLADPLGALKARATLEPVSTLLVTPPGQPKEPPHPSCRERPPSPFQCETPAHPTLGLELGALADERCLRRPPTRVREWACGADVSQKLK